MIMVKGIAKVRPVLLVALLIYTSFSNIRAQTSLYEFDFKDISLKNAMQQIEKKTGYVFFFNNSSIDINRNIKVRLHNASLEDIVKELFPNYQYKIENRKIILLSQYIVENIDVSGIIVDQQGVPIAGASVIEKNDLNNGIISNLDSFFRMTVPQNATIVVTCIGYMTEEVKVKKSRSLTVKLEEDQRVLNEIVVVGYGQVKKQDLTGAVVNVKMSDVEDTPVMSVDQTLQGRLAGVDIMSTTGEPGAVTSIRIRGTRSISATNEPLIVVDGVIDAINDIADINSSDIESISVLKDASSTAIYGSRGSNGVIIITTKQGRKGKPEIIFRSDLGLAQLPRSLDLMNGAEFAQYRNDYEYFISGGTGTQPFPNPLSYGEGTDWVKEVTQTALYQNYALSLSGGTDATSYYGSFSFNNTEGIIKSSGMKRYTGRIRLEHQLLPWLKIGYNLNYTMKDQDVNVVTLGGTNWWNAAIYLSPLIDVGSDFNNYWYAGQKFNSPRALIDQNTDILEKHVTTNTGYLKFSPLKNLEIRNQATYYRHGAHRYKYEPGTLPAKAEDEGGTAYRGEYKEYSILSENTISYKMSLKEEHKFDFLMGFTAQKWGSENLTLQGKGYQVDQIKWNNLGAIYDKSNYTTTSTMEEITRMSILSRFNYNYQNRYYLTFSGRADGSSNFAKNHKWGLFPSAALKWNIYNEPFIKDAGWLNELSVRLSLGRTGNDGIPPYRSLSAQ